MREPGEAAKAARGRGLGVGGLFLGRVLGVQVFVDWSVLIIFVLILINLGAGLFPAWHPGWDAALTWATALCAALLFLLSILAHELSHAVVARANDIPVPRITLFLFGGVAHMEREPQTPRAEFLMAVVGPITSIAIGLLAVAAGTLLAGPEFRSRAMEDPQAAMASVGPLASLLLWLGPINVVLGIFNVLPGFPLDGGRVFRAIAWWSTGDLRKATRWASGAGRLLAWALMAWGVMNLAGGALLQGVWLLLIGWFLNNAARATYQQLVVREELRGVHLCDVMRTRFATIAPQISVEELVRDELMASDQRVFPVVAEDGRLQGLVSLEDVRRLPPAEWAGTQVSSIMAPAGSLASLPPEASAERALELLGERGVDQIAVLEEERLVGLVRGQDLVKWLALHVQGLDLVPSVRAT